MWVTLPDPDDNPDNSPKMKIIFVILFLFLIGELGYFFYIVPNKKIPTTIVPTLTPTPPFITNKNELKITDLTNLNTDYTDIKKFTEITREDITSGRLAEFEKKYVSVSNNISYQRFFYKIKYDKNTWLLLVGAQVRNKDNSNSFLHYFVKTSNGLSGFESNLFNKASLPTTIGEDYFDSINIPRSYFSTDEDYYKKNGEVEVLMNERKNSGLVLLKLEKIILLYITNL